MDFTPEDRLAGIVNKEPPDDTGLDCYNGRELSGLKSEDMNFGVPETKNTSPPEDDSSLRNYTSRDIANYVWGVLALLVVLAGCRSFSYDQFHGQIRRFVTAVSRGGEIAIENVRRGSEITMRNAGEFAAPQEARITNRWERFSAEQKAAVLSQIESVESGAIGLAKDVAGLSKYLGVLDQNYAARVLVVKQALARQGRSAVSYFLTVSKNAGQAVVNINDTASEFMSGAGEGGDLAAENLGELTNIIRSNIILAVSSARESVTGELVAANERISAVKGSVAGSLAVWRASLTRRAGLSYQLAQTVEPKSIMAKLAETKAEPATSTTSVTTLPSGELVSIGFAYWRDQIFKQRIIPLAVISYDRQILAVRAPLNFAWHAIASGGVSLSSDIASAWVGFFGRLSSTGLSQTELREQIKNEVLAELNGTNNIAITDSNKSDMLTETGIVVMKPTGSSTIDIQNVKKLQDAFSDRVIVNFDEEGQTGVVQPIFRDRVGEKYLFLITPIKK